MFKLAGKFNWPALHVVAVLWTLLTMAGLYLIARRLFDRDAGLVAALLYSIFQPWGTWKNLAFNGELMMNLPLVWAWAAALRPRRERRSSELVRSSGSGLCSTRQRSSCRACRCFSLRKWALARWRSGKAGGANGSRCRHPRGSSGRTSHERG